MATNRTHARPTAGAASGRDASVTLIPAGRSWRARYWPAGLFLVTALVVFLRSWVHPATVIPGFPDDNKSFLWGLQWFAFALRHGHDPFVTTYIHAPAGINVFWNAWTPLLAVVLAPLTLLAGPEASYDVLVTASFALSGLAAWRAATRFVRPGTAVAVGLAYELSPYLLGHGGEDPMLVFAVFPPIVLLLGADLVRGLRSPARTGILLGLATAAQVWVDEEIATDVALVVGCALVVALVRRRRDVATHWRPLLVAAGVAGVTALVLSSPVLIIQFLGPDRITSLIQSPQNRSSVDLADIVRPPSTLLLSDAIHNSAGMRATVETTGYLGALPLLALISTVKLRRSRGWVQLLSLTALVTGSISVGVNLVVNGNLIFYPMPWDGLSKLPLLGQLQPGRLTLEVFLLVALLAGAGFDLLRTRRLSIALVLGGLTALSLVPVLPLTGTTRPAVPAFFRHGATAIPAGCLVGVAPLAYDGSTDDAMVWQAAADFRFRMLGGYVLGPIQHGQFSTYSPQPYPIVSWLALHDGASVVVPRTSDAQARTDIRALGVCDLVVGNPGEHSALVADIDRLLGRPPQLTGGVALWDTRSGT